MPTADTTAPAPVVTLNFSEEQKVLQEKAITEMQRAVESGERLQAKEVERLKQERAENLELLKQERAENLELRAGSHRAGFAAAALTGLLARSEYPMAVFTSERLADLAFTIADAMVAEHLKRSGG